LKTWPRPGAIYYGWIIVAALALTEVTSWGILYYALSAFLLAMEQELGWSRAALAGGFSLALAAQALMAIPVGRWLDRHGPRLLMSLGSILATLLVFAWSRVENLLTYYLIWTGLGMAMAAVLYEPAFATVARFFERDRPRALAVLTLVAGLASICFLPLANALLERWGWRTAVAILAAILGLITIPLHALILRRRPQDLGLEVDGRPVASRATLGENKLARPSLPAKVALRSRVFLAFTSSTVFAALATATVAIHVLPFLSESGHSAAFAAFVVGLVGAMQIPGRLFFAFLSRRMPARWLSAATFLLQALALFWLPWATSAAGAIVFSCLFGVGNGIVTLLRASRPAEFFGTANYGEISGVIAFASTMARAVAPVAIGFCYVWTGYRPLLLGLGVLLVAAAVTAFCAEVWAERNRGEALSLEAA
jgi:MFS family permease